MTENSSNGAGPVLTGKTGTETDTLTEQMILQTQEQIVPVLGAQQTCEALFNTMLFIAARNGADPSGFQRALLDMAKGSAARIRLLREVGGI